MADTIVKVGSASSNFSTFVRYSVWIGSQVGERKRLISNFTHLNVVLANKYHWASIAFPAENFPTDLLIEDAWIEVWREKAILGESPFLLVDWKEEIDTAGREVITITGFSAKYIFYWPVVAYDTGTAQAAKTDFADDMIKAIARENIGSSATDTTRDMSAMLTIEADKSEGTSQTKGFSRRKLNAIFDELCDASASDGTRLYWDVVLSAPGNLTSRILELRTYKDHRGDNRGLNSANSMVFSVQKGNLENVWRKESYRDAANYAYGLGQGLETSRNVQAASDTDRIAASPWGRIKETTKSATFSNSDAGVAAEAKAALWQSRPGTTVRGKIKITPNSLFGQHYRFGDLVVVESFDKRDEAMVAPVDITVSNGEESVDAFLSVEDIQAGGNLPQLVDEIKTKVEYLEAQEQGGVTSTSIAPWLNGSGVPSSGLGSDGDYYLDTDDNDLYYKSGGTWSLIANITGATGATGATGPTGPAGDDGEQWHVGSGSPSIATGNDGDFYLDSDTGDIYEKDSGVWGSPVMTITGGAPATEKYLVLQLSGNLSNERLFTPSPPLSAIDNGAGAAYELGVSAASESAAGKAEIATQTETNTGTDDARYVTPLKLKSTPVDHLKVSKLRESDDGGDALTADADGNLTAGGDVSISGVLDAQRLIIQTNNAAFTSDISLGGNAIIETDDNLRLICDSDDGSTVSAIIFAHDSDDTSDNYAELARINESGEFGLGVSSPQGQIHAHDGTSGHIIATKTGVNGTAQTVIPNGTGDVTAIIQFSVIIVSGAGAAVGQVSNLTPSNSTPITVGADTVTLAVSAAGAFTVQRTAGSNTHTVTIDAIWQ